ncbi:NAD(P)H-hydrate dehydratase [Candidatus Peregrinibacteria bacterium]|nr:NAD(P)H-hydrate dehydratase [Candidatus Peregrinibacteria bacterium]
MLKRKNDSHKGDNGKIMIVGGSEMFHGAPILSALAAEHSGVDLIFPYIPPCQAEAAKSYSLNFIIQKFSENILTNKDVKSILNLSKKMDVMVIGPGLGTNIKTKQAVKSIVSHITIPTVIDASALFYTNSFPKTTVLTPHRGEFKEMTGDEPTVKNVQKWAKQLGVTIVCKGHEDIIARGEEIAINKTGNSYMTVGGTGDVLSGLLGGLIAQGMDSFEACKYGTKILGLVAENQTELQGNFRAIDLVNGISGMIKTN